MTIVVVAAVVIENARVLVTQRMAGAHLAGMWEFPGGKVEPDEDPRDALARELREELGVSCEIGEVLDVAFHRYPTKSVLLLFYRATMHANSPAPQCLGVAAIQWRTAGELQDADFPPADVQILEKVRDSLRRESPAGDP